MLCKEGNKGRSCNYVGLWKFFQAYCTSGDAISKTSKNIIGPSSTVSYRSWRILADSLTALLSTRSFLVEELGLITNLEKASAAVDYNYIYSGWYSEIISCVIDQQWYVNQSIPVIVDQERCNAWKIFDSITCWIRILNFRSSKNLFKIHF